MIHYLSNGVLIIETNDLKMRSFTNLCLPYKIIADIYQNITRSKSIDKDIYILFGKFLLLIMYHLYSALYIKCNSYAAYKMCDKRWLSVIVSSTIYVPGLSSYPIVKWLIKTNVILEIM